MNELAAVQVNKSASQASSNGRTGKSGNTSDRGDSFSAIFNKATTESKSDTVKTESRSDTGKTESKFDTGKTKDKTGTDKNVGKKKEEEKTPEEYAALANSGSQTANDTTTDNTTSTENNSSVDSVENVSVDGNQNVEKETAPSITTIVTTTDGDDAANEITVDENDVKAFEDILKDNNTVLENGAQGNSITFNEQDNSITFNEKINIGIQNIPALSIDTSDLVEPTGDVKDTIIIPETNITQETQKTETSGTLQISTTSLNVGEITTITPSIDINVANDISRRQKDIIKSFPTEYEQTIDDMTTEFLTANPNPTDEQINTFFETMTNAIEQLVAKDNEIAGLNNKIDDLTTNLTAAASQISSLQKSSGDITIQQTIEDLSTNLQSMFQEIALSAQMTSPGTTSQLVLQLFPEHLGKLRIELTADLDGKITAKMQSGNATVRALLDSGIRDLIDCLKASGVDLKSLEVGKLEMELSNSDLGHRSNLQQDQQNQQNQQYGNQRQSSITRITATDPKTLTTALYNTAVMNSYVDENVSVEFTA